DGGVFVRGGWNIFNKLFRVNNWTGNGTESIFGETPGGDLYRYDYRFPTDFDPRHSIAPAGIGVGSGGAVFTDIIVTNNWNGDGLPNILGRTRAGDLFIYNSDGHGGWLPTSGKRIGVGFGVFNTMLTPGDWKGDGHQALIGRTPDGGLFLYESDGKG